eukprot:SAG11_NODE_37788_length_255_cov_0.666667_1_plen_37_part_01
MRTAVPVDPALAAHTAKHPMLVLQPRVMLGVVVQTPE